MIDEELVRLIRATIQDELRTTRLKVPELAGAGGNTVISSRGDIVLSPGIGRHAYYQKSSGRVEIGDATATSLTGDFLSLSGGAMTGDITHNLAMGNKYYNSALGAIMAGQIRAWSGENYYDFLIETNGVMYLEAMHGFNLSGYLVTDIDMNGYTFVGLARGTIDETTPEFQNTPIDCFIPTAGIYTNNGAGNNYHLSSWVKATGTNPTVAVFGEGIGEGMGSRVWGGNFVGIANKATATAIACEINAESMVSGGIAYGLISASAGNYPIRNHIQIQTNGTGSPPYPLSMSINGILFNGYDFACCSNAYITSLPNAHSPMVGIDFSADTFASNIAIVIANDASINGNKHNNTTSYRMIGMDTNNYQSVGAIAAGTDASEPDRFRGLALYSGDSVAMILERSLNNTTVGLVTAVIDMRHRVQFNEDINFNKINPGIAFSAYGYMFYDTTNNILNFNIANGIRFYIGETSAQIVGDFLPSTDATRQLGTSGQRWNLIRGVTITPGDLGFEETSCSICSKEFKVGELLLLQIKSIGDINAPIRTIPVHHACA